MEEEHVEYNPEQYEDIEDEGDFVQVGEKDREEQEKIKSKYAHLCRPPVDPNFSEKDVFEMMSIDVDYYLHKCKITTV